MSNPSRNQSSNNNQRASPSSDDLKCPICLSTYTAKKFRNQHMRLTHNNGSHHCFLCSSSYARPTQLKHHTMNDHYVALKTCSNRFQNRHSAPQSYKCLVNGCKKYSVDLMDLLSHQIEHHSGELDEKAIDLMFRCHRCKTNYADETSFNDHPCRWEWRNMSVQCFTDALHLRRA